MNQLQRVEVLTRTDIAEIHGEQYLHLSEPFLIEDKICSVFSYKAFIEMLLWTLMRKSEKDEYLRQYQIYQNVVAERFHMNQILINACLMKKGFHLSFLLNTGITDIYNYKFKNGEFKNEFDLEHVIYDSFYGFDNNETIKVQRQVEKIDLKITHNNIVFITELKKGKESRKNVYQVFDYCNSYELMGNEEMKVPVLIAKSYSDDVVQLARELDVSCYSYFILEELPYTSLVLEEALSNDHFDAFYDYFVSNVGVISSTMKGIVTNPRDAFNQIFNSYMKSLDIIAEFASELGVTGK